ncbi:hypothetical protein D3C87_1227750 [compost metagenome]
MAGAESVTVLLPESLKRTFVNVASAAAKLPEASRFTIAEAVFTLVAAFARSSALWTLTAVDPPTELTVLVTDPLPLAETSPVKAVIVPPALLSLAAIQLVPLNFRNCPEVGATLKSIPTPLILSTLTAPIEPLASPANPTLIFWHRNELDTELQYIVWC